MPIFKKEVKSDFTIVHNTFIRDENLGITARGLLLTMLSMSDDWNFSVKGLASILPDGGCKVTTAIKELERFGYLVRRKVCDKKTGRVIDSFVGHSEQIVSTGIVIFRKENQLLKGNFGRMALIP